MCHGNLAQASANFINAQLSALWENSKACNDKEPHKKESKDIVTKHGTAFREFYEESGSASLHAIFQIPHLEFLCNHELVLFLRVENGQYKAEKSRYGLKNTTLAVRLSYHFQDLSASLGGKHCDISILSFNSSSATLIAESSVLNHGQSHDFDALSLLLKNHYIPTLIDAGHLNLLVLPPSYTGKKEIDHGVIASRILPRSLLFGTQVAKLNEILNHHWLAAIRYHDAHKEVVSTELRDTYLSQYKATWLDGDLWAIYQFSPLRLQVLCSTEVIMHFKADIRVYRDDAEKELHSVLKDWEIAVIFRVVNKDGHVVLDQFHPPRIASHSCSLPCQPLEGNLDEVFRREFKLSILHTYVELIFQYGHYQLYPDFHEPSDPERKREGQEGRDVGEKPSPRSEPLPDPGHAAGTVYPGRKDTKFAIEWELLWKKFVEETETSLRGFHQLISVTQGGINAHLLALWRKAKHIGAKHLETDKRLLILTHFDSKKYTGGSAHLPHFSCELGAPQVELVIKNGSKSVIVYFFIQNISFELSNKVHQFKDWVLAFQFDLKLVPVKVTGSTGVEGHRQLILDPTTAVLLHHRSSFGSLVEMKETDIIRSLYGSLSTNFIQRYIKAFVDAEQHILYTIPIFGHEHHEHGVSEIAFSIVPFSVSFFGGRIFQGLWGKSYHIVERNMIVFYSVSGGDRIPEKPLVPGPFGRPSPHTPHGTLLLSRERFLETFIIKPLAEINARTTVLCTFSGRGVDRKRWEIVLGTWGPQRLSDDCQWERKEHSADRLNYEWENIEMWQYYAHGKGIAEGSYTITVKTLNKLSIPTGDHSGPLVIQLKGESTLSLKYEFHPQKHWSGGLKATWETPIELVSDSGSGLSIKYDKQIKADVQKTQDDHTEKAFDVGRLALESLHDPFKTVFASSISNFGEIFKGLNSSFSGIYKGLRLPHTDFVLANPAFTANGDLLLQILVKTVERPVGHPPSGFPLPEPPSPQRSVIQYLNTPIPAFGSLPSLQAAPEYNFNSDVEKLKEALKSSGTNEELLIQTLTPLSAMHLAILTSRYRASTGKDLLTAIESISGRWIRNLMSSSRQKDVLAALVRGPISYDIKILHEALSSAGSDESVLAELLADRSPSDLHHLGQAYKSFYGKTLEEAVKIDLSGKLQILYTMILSSKRTPDDTTVDKALVEADVKALYEAGEKKVGTNETAFCNIIISRSRPHLTALWDAYVHQHGKTLSNLIKSEFPDKMRTTLLYIVNAANPKRINEGAGVWRDVKLLEDTMMNPLGTSDDMLVRRLIRLHWDQSHFALVNQAFERKYKQSLESRVEGETSGYYQKAVVGLVKGATRVPPTSGPSSTSGKESSKVAPVPAAATVPPSTPKSGVAVGSNGKGHEESATPKSNGHSSPKDDKKAKKSTNGKAQSGAAGDDGKDAGELKVEIVY